MTFAECPKEIQPFISNELKNFFNTGNCELLPKLKTCINPTLLEVPSGKWVAHILACPFEGFIPIPYKKLTASAVADRNGGKILLSHCKAILKGRLIKFKALKKNVTFFFHIGDCLLLCLLNPNLKNLFQVIQTSNLADHLGHANLLHVASNYLDDKADSLLLTESMNWQSLVPSVLEYVENSLCCPLSMIPTLYGLRLTNHLHLGNRIPVNVFRNAPNPVTLTWKKAPAYSANIGLTVSPALQRALAKLQKLCFKPVDENSTLASGLQSYTPMTFYYVVQSLVTRGVWIGDVLNGFLQPHLVPKEFQLFWQTLEDWFSGKEVLLYQATCDASDLDSDATLNPIVHNALVNLVLDNRVSMTDRHYVTNFILDWKSAGVEGKGTISFIMAKDRDLPGDYYVSVVNDSHSTTLLSVGYLKNFCQTTARNPLLLKMKSSPIDSTNSELQVLSCSESEDQYELDIIVNGAVINESYGKTFYRFVVNF